MAQFMLQQTMDRREGLLTYDKNILSIGSCFADQIGTRLAEDGFSTTCNPFGVIYNPLAMVQTLLPIPHQLLANHTVSRDGLFMNLMAHSNLFGQSESDLLLALEATEKTVALKLAEADIIILTLGTAWAFTYLPTGKIVSNNHKLPATQFSRRLLAVDEIATSLQLFMSHLAVVGKACCQVIVTVSPVIHGRDRLDENMLSKSTLRLATAQFVSHFPEKAIYFPAYEILRDELRDYRFFADDMQHPSKQATDIIYQRFLDTYTSAATLHTRSSIGSISKALAHRPMHEPEDAKKKRLLKIGTEIDSLPTIVSQAVRQRLTDLGQ